MKLHTKEIPVSKRTAEVVLVARFGIDTSLVGNFREVAMYKIKLIALFKSRQQGMRSYGLDLIPPHVRHLEAGVGKIKPPYPTFDQRQCLGVALFRVLEGDLQSEANAEHRHSGPVRLKERPIKTRLLQTAHGAPRRTHTGKDDPTCRSNTLWIVGNLCDKPHLGAGTGNAPQVARLVINDDCGQSRSVPRVRGELYLLVQTHLIRNGLRCEHLRPLRMITTMYRFDAVLLCNLGSPKSTRIDDVRSYLREFLMDPYVLQMPSFARWLLVNLLILPFRPARTAEAYASIWSQEGSPLLAYSQKLKDALGRYLRLPVVLGMRYGSPSLEEAFSELSTSGAQRILLAPLYPQFADSTNTTCIEQATRIATRLGIEMQVLAPFYQAPAWLDAVSESCRRAMPTDIDCLLFSFHGLPEIHIKRADPTGTTCLNRSDCCEAPAAAAATCYRHQCLVSAREIAQRLGLRTNQHRVAFQSRLGRAKWLQPATDQVLERLPLEGVKRLAVVCPGFTADNLETLEEIGIRGRQAFLQAGGESFTLLPCLNDDPAWIEALAALCMEQPSATT